MRLHFFSARHNEKTFKDSHRRKAFQMQPMWSWIFTSWAFDEAHGELWKQGQNIKQTSEKATTHWKCLRNGKRSVMHFLKFCLSFFWIMSCQFFSLNIFFPIQTYCTGPARRCYGFFMGGGRGWVGSVLYDSISPPHQQWPIPLKTVSGEGSHCREASYQQQSGSHCR